MKKVLNSDREWLSLVCQFSLYSLFLSAGSRSRSVFGIRILIHKVQLGFGFTTLKPNKNILAFFIYFFLVGLINTVNKYHIDYVIYYFTYSFYFQEEVFNLQ